MPISRILGRYRPLGRTEEITMHPTLCYHLAQARAADLRHRAQRDILARTADRARPGRREYAVPRWPAGWRLASHLGLDPSLCTRSARASHHDRRDR